MRKRPETKQNLLTVKKIQAAGDGDHYDGGGLQLRVRGSSRTWVLRYTSPTGRRREMGFGALDSTNDRTIGAGISTARDLARDARDLLKREVDPIDDRNRRTDAERQAEQARKDHKEREQRTLARVARDYHARVIEPSRTPRHAASWINSLEHHVPSHVWHMPVADVTAPILLQALMAAKPHERARRPGDLSETTRRVRQRLDAVLEDAAFFGRCAGNAAAATRRKLSEARPPAAVRHLRALPYAEVPVLMARLRLMQGVAARALEFTTLTASRTSEVLNAEWSEFDLSAGVWTVPASRMKLRQPHRVHLSPRALAIIEAQRGQDVRFVFPSPQAGREGAALSNMAMLVTLDRLGVRDRTTVHGLARSSFSTWANETPGVARPDVIEACLAHSEADHVRKAYNRSAFDTERRALLAAWATYCDHVATPATYNDIRRGASHG